MKATFKGIVFSVKQKTFKAGEKACVTICHKPKKDSTKEDTMWIECLDWHGSSEPFGQTVKGDLVEVTGTLNVSLSKDPARPKIWYSCFIDSLAIISQSENRVSPRLEESGPLDETDSPF